MAFLGNSSRIIVSSENIERSVNAWTSIGFELQGESGGRSRLSDGQVLLTIMQDRINSPALTYFHNNVSLLKSQCDKNNIEAFDCSSPAMKTIRIMGPGGLQIYTHEKSQLTNPLPTKEQSPLLGWFDAFVVGVPDVHVASDWVQRAGYFIQEDWQGAHQQVDATDGLMVISFRQEIQGQFLAYYADVDDELVRLIEKETGGTGVVVKRVTDTLVKITMPEGTVIMVLDDSLDGRNEEDDASIDDV